MTTLILAASLLLLAAPAHAKTAWTDYFAKTDTYIFYLDQDETHKDGHLLTATVKMIPLRRAFRETITRQRSEAGVTTAGYEGYGYTVQVWEIDLAARLHRVVKSTDHGAGGAVLDSAAWPQAEFEHITAGSVVDKLLYELPTFPTPSPRPMAAPPTTK